MLGALYIAIFFATIQYALLHYVGSTFIKEAVSLWAVEPLYIASSLTTILLLSATPWIVARFGHFWVNITTISAMIVSAGMVASGITNPLVLALLFLTLFTLQTELRVGLDLYTEKYSKNATVGRTRGLFLTSTNIGVAISPFLAGLFLAQGKFSLLFLASGTVLFPVFLILALKFRSVPDMEPKRTSLSAGLRKLIQNPDLVRIFSASTLLEFFYAWMGIYTPLYLAHTMGFSWERGEIGFIFSIMLLAFPLFQLPAGIIADRFWGEKEMLTAGFIIMGIATLSLSFITSTALGVWAFALFATRIGASLVEVMSDAYFFKKVHARDADIVGFFRNARPIAYILATAIGAPLLPFVNGDYRVFFIILGALMVFGAHASLGIKDTR